MKYPIKMVPFTNPHTKSSRNVILLYFLISFFIFLLFGTGKAFQRTFIKASFIHTFFINNVVGNNKRENETKRYINFIWSCLNRFGATWRVCLYELFIQHVGIISNLEHTEHIETGIRCSNKRIYTLNIYELLLLPTNKFSSVIFAHSYLISTYNKYVCCNVHCSHQKSILPISSLYFHCLPKVRLMDEFHLFNRNRK